MPILDSLDAPRDALTFPIDLREPGAARRRWRLAVQGHFLHGQAGETVPQHVFLALTHRHRHGLRLGRPAGWAIVGKLPSCAQTLRCRHSQVMKQLAERAPCGRTVAALSLKNNKSFRR